MKKILVVIDYQNDFVTGSLGFQSALALEGAIIEKIKQYEADGHDIVYTMDTHDDTYLNTNEGKHLPIKHCIKDTEGWKLFGTVAELLSSYGSICFEKQTFGSFQLGQYLQSKEYDEIELVGVVSNICVISNAVIAKAALPNAQIIVDAACVASNDEKMNQMALSIMKDLHIKILNDL